MKYNKSDMKVNISMYLEIYRSYIDSLDSYGETKMYLQNSATVRLNSPNYVIYAPKVKLLNRLQGLGLHYVVYDEFITVSYRKKDQI